MLSIPGRKYRLCDGVSRRDVLKIGALAMGGLTLPELLRREARAGRRLAHVGDAYSQYLSAPTGLFPPRN